MKTLIKNAKIYCRSSQFDQKTVDMLIIDGIIAEISENTINKAADKIISHDNLAVSIGWIDASVSFGEPGLEDRETIINGLLTAEKSGFTTVCVNPNSQPVISTQEGINFLIQKSKEYRTQLLPIGALTIECEGHHMAELYDMHLAGAIAFSDYKKSIDNANLLKVALQYTKDFDGLIMAYSQDEQLKGKGVVHEGLVSTKLGLKGIPTIAESVVVARNLELLKYTNHRLHLSTISTEASLDLIAKAKQDGLQVSCSVAAHHLCLTDELLVDFDSNYKVLPPLRDEKTRLALIEGIKNGTIDSIVSDHQPLTIESKRLEFDLAKFGAIGLESCFGALNHILPTDLVIEKLTNARQWLKLEVPQIKVGEKANLTLFNPDEKWIFEEKDILSSNKNSAFVGQPMKGKAVEIINYKSL
jgi:dihydroorotase